MTFAQQIDGNLCCLPNATASEIGRIEQLLFVVLLSLLETCRCSLSAIYVFCFSFKVVLATWFLVIVQNTLNLFIELRPTDKFFLVHIYRKYTQHNNTIEKEFDIRINGKSK